MSTSGLGTPNYFKKRYVGPIGAHLMHRTYFTQTGTSAKEDTQRSIHPRVIGGQTISAKVNTSLPHREKRGVNPFGITMRKARAKGR